MLEHRQVIPVLDVTTSSQVPQPCVATWNVQDEDNVVGGGLLLICWVAMRSPVPVGRGSCIILPGAVTGPVLRFESDPREIAVGIFLPYLKLNFSWRFAERGDGVRNEQLTQCAAVSTW